VAGPSDRVSVRPVGRGGCLAGARQAALIESDRAVFWQRQILAYPRAAERLRGRIAATEGS